METEDRAKLGRRAKKEEIHGQRTSQRLKFKRGKKTRKTVAQALFGQWYPVPKIILLVDTGHWTQRVRFWWLARGHWRLA